MSEKIDLSTLVEKNNNDTVTAVELINGLR